MSLVDEYTFYAAAGKGGDGVVRWRREKFLPKGGPCGGDGGRGGDVYIEGVRDITRLNKLVRVKEHHANDGLPGSDNSKTGAAGNDLTIYVPVGSLVTRTSTGDIYELLTEGERIRILEGGERGLGNEHFKSSTNQQPRQCTKGKSGEADTFSVELRLIADAGLIGLPNAGKTSLLNVLTRAGAKVGDYPFTTLDPNLGAYYGNVIADIPGLIEGASAGKGLGAKFLRHIARTRILLHIISCERDEVTKDYNVVRGELAGATGLLEKPEYIVLTKTDTVTPRRVQEIVEEIGTITASPVIGTISILDDESIAGFARTLSQLLQSR